MPKNKITTQGYFVKKLRDIGYYVDRVYSKYGDDDQRKWTVVVNPGTDSVFITCRDNGEWPYRGLYEFGDSGARIPRGYHINTESTQVVAKHLSEFNITPGSINNNDGTRRQTGQKTETDKEVEEVGKEVSKEAGA
jgi:hypothetical protein